MNVNIKYHDRIIGHVSHLKVDYNILVSTATATCTISYTNFNKIPTVNCNSLIRADGGMCGLYKGCNSSRGGNNDDQMMNLLEILKT
jgi:hypothetical protein